MLFFLGEIKEIIIIIVFETIINCFYAKLTIFSTKRDFVIRVKMRINRMCFYYNAE